MDKQSNPLLTGLIVAGVAVIANQAVARYFFTQQRKVDAKDEEDRVLKLRNLQLQQHAANLQEANQQLGEQIASLNKPRIIRSKDQLPTLDGDQE